MLRSPFCSCSASKVFQINSTSTAGAFIFRAAQLRYNRALYGRVSCLRFLVGPVGQHGGLAFRLDETFDIPLNVTICSVKLPHFRTSNTYKLARDTVKFLVSYIPVFILFRHGPFTKCKLNHPPSPSNTPPARTSCIRAPTTVSCGAESMLLAAN